MASRRRDKAQYKGTGTPNGASGSGFMLTATGSSPREFPIKMRKTADDTIVYDNPIGGGHTADPTTAITGGSLQIHES